ncbi:hypothetical protein [Lachnospira multipara]|uniref:hypothetical protein n=1 Tax=Lachnospira multipara TaxID=28051 RepID=UPI0012DF3EC3|nr:hypothetical protein [Lachnospira multipara]
MVCRTKKILIGKLLALMEVLLMLFCAVYLSDFAYAKEITVTNEKQIEVLFVNGFSLSMEARAIRMDDIEVYVNVNDSRVITDYSFIDDIVAPQKADTTITIKVGNIEKNVKAAYTKEEYDYVLALGTNMSELTTIEVSNGALNENTEIATDEYEVTGLEDKEYLDGVSTDEIYTQEYKEDDNSDQISVQTGDNFFLYLTSLFAAFFIALVAYKNKISLNNHSC